MSATAVGPQTIPGVTVHEPDVDFKRNIAIRIMQEASIIHPTLGRIPFRPYDYQVKFWLDTSRYRVVLKARQIGMSQAVAAEALYKAMLAPNRTILFISKNMEDAKRLLKQAHDIYEELRHPPTRVKRDLQQAMTFRNGSQIISLAAGRQAGRGYPASDVYLDEAAYLQWDEDIYNAVEPAIAQGGTLTVLSTPNGQRGLFFDIWEGGKGKGWSRHEIPFWMCPKYDQGWFVQKRGTMSSSAFATEFGCSFVASGDPVFRVDVVADCPHGWIGYQPPVPGHLYVTSWDIARSHDWTVGITLDVTDPIHQLVRFVRVQGYGFPEQQMMIAQTWQMYPGLHVVEGNSFGWAVIENLPWPANTAIFMPQGMHLSQLVQQGVAVPFGAIVSFYTGGENKVNIIDGLQLAAEARRIKHDEPQITSEMKVYQRDDKKITQDTIMALATAEWAANHATMQQLYENDINTGLNGWDASGAW